MDVLAFFHARKRCLQGKGNKLRRENLYPLLTHLSDSMRHWTTSFMPTMWMKCGINVVFRNEAVLLCYMLWLITFENYNQPGNQRTVRMKRDLETISCLSTQTFMSLSLVPVYNVFSLQVLDVWTNGRVNERVNWNERVEWTTQPTAVVLKFQPALKSPGELLNHRSLGPMP